MLETLIVMAALGAGGDRVDLDSPLVGERTTVFRASTVHLGDGRVLDGGVVLVQDGVIREVGVGLEPPAGALIVEHDGALTPGLVALHGFEGGGSELLDSTRPFLPGADASSASTPTTRTSAAASTAGSPPSCSRRRPRSCAPARRR